ncbi:MAG: hypothetical protein KDK48_00600, partial [Chlamydiia bacterium]|nr:hypothetical protein [Chlamydiia bacterium]
MKKSLFLSFLSCITFLTAEPKYALEIVGPQDVDSHASAINAKGEIAGFYKEDEMEKGVAGVFFWSEEHETVLLGNTFEAAPKLDGLGKVYFSQRTPAGWFTKEKVRPVVWSGDAGLTEITLPDTDWSGKKGYVHCVNDLGEIVVGDALSPSNSTLQQIGDGTSWKATDIEVHDINNNGLHCGAYRHRQEGQTYQLPAILDASSGQFFVFQFVGILFTVSDKDDTAGVFLDKGKKQGLFFNFHSDNYLKLEDFYIRKLTKTGFALASSVLDTVKDDYLIDFNSALIY